MIVEVNYIDDSIIVVEKPAGLPTLFSKAGNPDSLAKELLEKYPELGDIEPKGEAGILHRLDNDTSGLILVAKNQHIYDLMKAGFKRGDVLKVYLALVVGRVSGRLVLDKPIAHHPKKKSKMVVSSAGREAITVVEVLKVGGHPSRLEESYSLLRVLITKGARHQIRVHLASAGHPLVGDRLYNRYGNGEGSLFAKRQFLHAGGLFFKHPKTDCEVCFFSPLPRDLLKLISGPNYKWTVRPS